MALPVIFGYSVAVFLGTILPQVAWVILKGLGVGALVFTGVDLLQSYFVDYIQDKLLEISTASIALFQIYGLLNIDVIINGSMSALAVFFTIRGLCSSGRMSQLKLGLPIC